MATTSAAPSASVAIGDGAAGKGSVSNAGAVVAAMAPGFRGCYYAGLQKDESMKGSVRLTAKIGPAGEVVSVVPSEGGGLSDEVKVCMVEVVAKSTFAAPEGGGATIAIPVTFFPM